MSGLLSYLQGPGRHNEHERPHLVAGDPGVMAWYAETVDGAMPKETAMRLARYLERPRRAHGVEATRPAFALVDSGERDGHGHRVMERRKVGVETAHVYHVALSARAEEGLLGDELWQRIAEEFVTRMGLVEPSIGAEGERSDGVRWAAMHHGVSDKGNDHVHLVINLVREDGEVLDPRRDFVRAKQVCRDLEDEFGLMPLHPNEYELARTWARNKWEQARREELAGDRPVTQAGPRFPWRELSDAQQHNLVAGEFGTRAEFEQAWANRGRHANPETANAFTSQGARESIGRARARAAYERDLATGAGAYRGTEWAQLPKQVREQLTAAATPQEDPKKTLARQVRAAATAAADEAEFVRRLRQQGVLVRPRYAQGRTDVVEGFSVALRPSVGERPIWRGGGRLGGDLGLPRLRESSGWDTSVEAAQAAVEEWRAVATKKRPVDPGRERSEPAPEAWDAAVREISALTEQLRGIGIDDTAAWAQAARQAAGVYAAWSRSMEPVPGPYAAAAEALGRSAQTAVAAGRGRTEKPVTALPSCAGTAMLLLAASTGPAGAQKALLLAMGGLTKAITDMQAAAHNARAAQLLESEVRGQLVTVARGLAAAEQTEAAAMRQAVLERDFPEAVAARRLVEKGQGVGAAGRPVAPGTADTAVGDQTRPPRRPGAGHGQGNSQGPGEGHER